MCNEVDGDCETKPLLEERSPSMQSSDASPNNALEVIFENGAPVGVATTSAKKLPFEFGVLEACIESARMCLEYEVCKVLQFVVFSY